MKRCFIIFLCFGLMLSCKKKDDSTPTTTSTTTTTTTSSGPCGSGSFSLNGVPKSHNGLSPHTNSCHESMLQQVGGTNVSLAFYLSKYGTTVSYNSGNPDYVLQVVISDFNGVNTGTYSGSSLLTVQASYQVFSSGSQVDYTNLEPNTPNTNGTINLTKLDLTNLLISGTFSFTGYNTSNASDIVTISNGTFQDLPFYIQ